MSYLSHLLISPHWEAARLTLEEGPHNIPPYAIIPHTYPSLGALRGVRRKARHARPRCFVRLSRRWHPCRRRRRAGRSDFNGGSEEIGVQRGRARADSFSDCQTDRVREETRFGSRAGSSFDCQGRPGAGSRPSCRELTPAMTGRRLPRRGPQERRRGRFGLPLPAGGDGQA